MVQVGGREEPVLVGSSGSRSLRAQNRVGQKPGRPVPPLLLFPAAFVVYGLLALLAHRPILPGTSSQIGTCACSDPALQTWFLGWVPYALAHGHNPMFTTWTNYPLGVNLTQNAWMPLLGLVTAPLTVLASPIASYNLLAWIGFPASATAMFYVARRCTGSTVGGFAAGLVYGFSAYMVGQGIGHVMLTFVPIPPLFFYRLHALAVRRGGHPYRDGIALGVLAVLQFFVDAEVFASLMLIGFFAVVLLAGTNLRAVTRPAMAYVARGIAAGAVLTAVVVAYPAWYEIRGPQHITGPAQQPGIIESSLLAPLIPTASQHFAPHVLAQHDLTFGNVENGAYLGLPLVLLLLFFVIRFRHNRWLLFFGGMSVISFVLSLGSHLALVNGHTSVPLPFDVIAKLPLVDNLLPARLSLYVSLWVALAVAAGTAETVRSLRSGSLRSGSLGSGSLGSGSRFGHSRRQARSWWPVATASVLGVAAVVTLLPGWPYARASSNVPRFFTTSAVQRIPAGSVVLTYPFPYYPVNQSMIWQSASGMRFRMVGGYGITPDPQGTVSFYPTVLPPADVQQYLVAAEGLAGAAPGPPSAQLVSDLRRYLRTYSIDAVVVGSSDPTVGGLPLATALFTKALGPPQSLQGVSVWFDVPSLVPRIPAPLGRGGYRHFASRGRVSGPLPTGDPHSHLRY